MAVSVNTVHICIEELDEPLATIDSASEIEVLSEPVDRLWGAHDVAVRDSAGSVVRVQR